MLQSSKKPREFEEILIESVKYFFQKQGYSVSTHARLNIAWSNIISDIDIIATLADEVVIIEVKSNRDHFYRGFEQLQKVKGFADKIYLATNKSINSLNLEKWRDDTVGLLHIKKGKIEVIKSAENISSLLPRNTFSQLKKKCLMRLVRLLDIPTSLPKTKIDQMLRSQFNETDLKIIAKNIALCDEDCEKDCILEPFLVATCNDLKIKQNKFSREEQIKCEKKIKHLK